jgi:hypothetical protein
MRIAMSKSALLFIVLTLMVVAFDLLLPPETATLSYAAKIAAGLFFCSFLIALMLGRRFKFDPVLR